MIRESNIRRDCTTNINVAFLSHSKPEWAIVARIVEQMSVTTMASSRQETLREYYERSQEERRSETVMVGRLRGNAVLLGTPLWVGCVFALAVN
jgi:hypothetical protein